MPLQPSGELEFEQHHLHHGGDDARHPGWDVALAWLKAADSELVQAFVGVARGRRGASSR